ncbi:MAG TPA: CBASS cGAMP synthase [Caulobacteraceae bacterium]|jgi:hypothetical protein
MYNAHKLFYQPAPQPCLKNSLVISDLQRNKLLRARKLVRAALRSGLARASDYAPQDEYYNPRYLVVAKRADLRDKSLRPLFRTQGSWAYDTLNQPARHGQQIDLDEGMYLPMSILEGAHPAVASSTLYKIVEAILVELCEAEGWNLDTSKNICIRMEIDSESHIDLNIYAVPDAKVELLERAMAKSSAAADSATHDPTVAIRLNPEEVYVAHRKKGWEQSDPLELEDWFVDAVKRHKAWTDLRRIVRYIKAWRDERWDACRLSSLSLMVCAVDALDEANTPPLPNRDDDGLLVVARALAIKLGSPIYNPVVESKQLNDEWSVDERNQFQLAARLLASEMEKAITSEASAGGALQRLRKLFGPRMPNDTSLISAVAVIEKVRSISPARAPSPRVGTSTSG